MNVVLKEGWLVLDMIYSHGGEVWKFYSHKPDSIEDVYDSRTEDWGPGQTKRILYCEADSAQLVGQPEDTQ